MKRLALCTALWLLCSCGLAAPLTGRNVSPGVGRALFEVRTNGTDLVPMTVLFPSDDEGRALPGPRPAVVFIQGGFVGRSRYEWQGEALARAGYVVVLPQHQLDLAFFSIEYGQAARGLLVAPPPNSLLEGLVDPARVAVAGHSLGSVVAMKLALGGGFAAVVLEAGFPDSGDAAKVAAFTRPSLSLAGDLDCSAKVASVRAGWDTMPSPTALAVLEGVTHYQFTDADTEDRQRECVPRAELTDAHARISQAMLAFLDAALSDGTVGEPALRLVPGATVEVR
ncbi:MAG: alpha/beta hydrolase [Archangium sp.]|nr:alpha/beta hydrolase [Archangium sp.]